MAEKKFTVLDMLELDLPGYDALQLKCIAGRRGLPRAITVPDINRPGLALSGFYDNFACDRVQLFGRGETAYLAKLHENNQFENIRTIFNYKIPCCIFSYELEPGAEFIRLAEEMCCPILQTPLATMDFSARIIRIFSNIFAPQKSMHGVLVEVYGIGILITGQSGVGKSETALELVERGHRLVADDVVAVRCVNGNSLIGRGENEVVNHHMEIRGLGIINISQLYGVGAVLEQKEINFVIRLEEWNSEKAYDRIGLTQQFETILGVNIPATDIPVRPGRNLPIIIEAAAMNERLKKMGCHSAWEFNQNVLKWIENGKAREAYYGSDDLY
ncbi:MAG: HPr(Ser) kinase/phosphatase [Treponemataceae bacterium]|nr:HPr(Ser) kinase/phosphatase [Treponemataceae bacterium]